MKILLATDGSSDARDAAEWLRHLPFPADREVLVVSVVPSFLVPAMADVTVDLRSAMLEDATRLVNETAVAVGAATGTVVEGDPRDAIVATAETWKADLVVLGARGLGAVQHALLGSVSLGVARHAPCPVLVCKGAPRAIRVITAAVDGSEPAREAVAWVAALPLAAGTRVRLLGVVEPEHFPSSAPGIVRATLRAALDARETERRAALQPPLEATRAMVTDRAASAEVVVATGRPADVIVRDAEQSGSDLIVLGARGLGMVKRFVLGSVSESVVRHAGCPVLVVRP